MQLPLGEEQERYRDQEPAVNSNTLDEWHFDAPGQVSRGRREEQERNPGKDGQQKRLADHAVEPDAVR